MYILYFLFLVFTSSPFREFEAFLAKCLAKHMMNVDEHVDFVEGLPVHVVARYHPTALSFDHQGCDTVRATAVGFSLAKLYQ